MKTQVAAQLYLDQYPASRTVCEVLEDSKIWRTRGVMIRVITGPEISTDELSQVITQSTAVCVRKLANERLPHSCVLKPGLLTISESLGRKNYLFLITQFAKIESSLGSDTFEKERCVANLETSAQPVEWEMQLAVEERKDSQTQISAESEVEEQETAVETLNAHNMTESVSIASQTLELEESAQQTEEPELNEAQTCFAEEYQEAKVISFETTAEPHREELFLPVVGQDFKRTIKQDKLDFERTRAGPYRFIGFYEEQHVEFPVRIALADQVESFLLEQTIEAYLNTLAGALSEMVQQ